MRVVGNEYVSASEQVVTNGDAVDGGDVSVVPYTATIADDDGWFEMVAVMRVPCRQLYTWRNVGVVAHGYVL